MLIVKNYFLASSEYLWKCFYSFTIPKAAICKSSHCGPFTVKKGGLFIAAISSYIE